MHTREPYGNHSEDSMKKKFSIMMILILIVGLVFCFTACSDRDENTNEGGDNTGINPPPIDGGDENKDDDTGKFYSVVIYNNGDITEKEYEKGTEITIKAKVTSGSVFVCWLVENEEYSNSPEITYKVEKDVVIKGVYTSYDKVVLDTEGGELSTEEIKVHAYGNEPIVTDGILYVGYKYSLPVPQKKYYTFTGWFAGRTKLTDENGMAIADYSGIETELKAYYKENPYVNIVLAGDNVEVEKREVKHYLEDGGFEVTAIDVQYKKLSEWRMKKLDGTYDVVSNEGNFILDVSNFTVGAKYTFYAYYTEAYKVIVKKGSGTGAYARDESVTVSAIKDTGRSFAYWMIENCYLGFYENKLCLFDTNQLDNYYFYYYDDTLGDDAETKTVTVSVPIEEYVDDGKFVYAQAEGLEIPMTQLEGLLIAATKEGFDGKYESEKETVISANFTPNIYSLVFELNCVVNGKVCITEQDKEKLIEMGFVETGVGTNVFEKEVYKEYKEEMTLEPVPEIAHYTFGNWQRKGGGEIPSVMPADDGIVLRGTYIPDKHLVTIQIRDSEKYKGSLFMEGNVTEAYFAYGTSITITVKANKGFVANEWLNISSDKMWEKDGNNQGEITLKSESMENEVITYVFNYTVAERQTFTMNFDERPYRIDYVITVEYTQKGDVTENPDFFEGTEGQAKFAKIKTMTEYVKYNTENCNFKTLTFNDPGSETYVDTGLRWGNSHWEFSGWSADNQGLTSLKDFTMPSKNLVVSAKFTIKKHRVSFSGYGTAGIIPTATQINGIDSEIFRIMDSEVTEYMIPYGATIKVNTVYPIGYRYGDVKINGETIYDSSENGTIKEVEFEKVSPNDKYTYDLTFDFVKVNAGTVPIAFYANQNTYTMKYYVNVDFENIDPDINLYDYIELDKEEEEEKAAVVGGVKYYYLKSIKTPSGVTKAQQNYVYNNSISLHSLSPTAYKYTFSNWKKFVLVEKDGVPAPGVDVGMRMPDENCISYGNLILNTYEFSIGVRPFDFEENPHEEKLTANIENTVSTGNSNDADDELRYYTAKTLSNYNAKGYDFINWRLETAQEGMETAYLNVNPSDLTVGETVTTEVHTVGGVPYTYKYRLNEDGTFTVFMTTKVCVYAQFSKMKFTVNIKDSDLSVSSDNLFEEDDKNYVEYGENFNFRYNFNRITIGKKLTEIVITNADKQESDEGYEIDVISINYDEDILGYKDINAIYSEIAEGVTSNINISTRFDDIRYKITYVVYGAQDNVADLDINDQNVITTDFNGEPYYATYSEKIQLMSEETLKQHLEELNVNTDGVMYSGWQSSLTNTSKDGEGFNGDAGSYENPRMHNQKIWGSEGMDAKPVYYCYLINTFKYVDVQAGVTVGINPVILSINNYKKYFADTRKEIVIPEMKGEYKVVKITDNGFNGCSGLEKLYMNLNATEIGTSAFSGCTYLEEVVINDEASLTIIGESAFENCVSLQNFGITEGERKLTFPKYLTTVKDKAFNGCTFIKDIEITQNVINMGNMAFSNMNALNRVYFGSGVKEVQGIVGKGVFYNSGASGNEGKGIDFVVGKKSTYVPEGLFSCQSTKETECGGKYLWKVSFEEEENAYSVTIAPSAFYMSGISEFVGSERLQSMGASAFYACGNLETVNLLNTKLTTIRDDTFRNCSKLHTVFLPSTTKEIGRAAFNGSYALQSVYYAEDENSTTNGFERIGDYAFGESTESMKLERIVPYSYYEEVQKDKNKHKTIIIGSAESIGKSAFIGCEVFERLEITGESTNFGALAFSGTIGLGEIYYNIKRGKDSEAGASSIFANAGRNTGTKLEIGPNVERIPAYVFYKFNEVLSVTIPETVLEIGEGAFSEMLKLETINYNAISLTSEYDGASAFNDSGWDNINLIIGKNVKKIPKGMFRGVVKIKTLDMSALSGAEKLDIGTNAFLNTGISSVDIPYTKELVINSDAFSGTVLDTFNVSSDTEKVVLYKNSLMSSTITSATMFGKDLYGGENGFWGYIYEGTLVVTKNESGGYDGVVDGNITVTGDMLIDKNDTILFNGESSIYIEYGNYVLVKGELNCSDSYITVQDGAELIGAIYTENNLTVKNETSSYTGFIIKENVTFENHVEIGAKNSFIVETGKTAVFNSGFMITKTIEYSGNIEIIEGGISIEYVQFNTGKIIISEQNDAKINNIEVFGVLNGFNISKGTVELIPTTEQGISETFVITENSELEITQNPNGRIKVDNKFIVKGALEVNCEAELTYVTVDGTVNVGNEQGTTHKLTVLYKESEYPEINGVVNADNYKIITGEKQKINYYGRIETAIAEGTAVGDNAYYLMRDIERPLGILIDKKVDLNFNEYIVDTEILNITDYATFTAVGIKFKGTIKTTTEASKFITTDNDVTVNYIEAKDGNTAIINNDSIKIAKVLVSGTNGIEINPDCETVINDSKIVSEETGIISLGIGNEVSIKGSTIEKGKVGIRGEINGIISGSTISAKQTGIYILQPEATEIGGKTNTVINNSEINSTRVGVYLGVINNEEYASTAINIENTSVSGNKNGILYEGGGYLKLKANAKVYSAMSGYGCATVHLKDTLNNQVVMSAVDGVIIENKSNSTTDENVTAVLYEGHILDAKYNFENLWEEYDPVNGNDAVNCSKATIIGDLVQTAVIFTSYQMGGNDYFKYDETTSEMKLVEYDEEDALKNGKDFVVGHMMKRLYLNDGTEENKIFISDKKVNTYEYNGTTLYYSYIIKTKTSSEVKEKLTTDNVMWTNTNYTLDGLGSGLTMYHTKGELRFAGTISGDVYAFNSGIGSGINVRINNDALISSAGSVKIYSMYSETNGLVYVESGYLYVDGLLEIKSSLLYENMLLKIFIGGIIGDNVKLEGYRIVNKDHLKVNNINCVEYEGQEGSSVYFTGNQFIASQSVSLKKSTCGPSGINIISNNIKIIETDIDANEMGTFDEYNEPSKITITNSNITVSKITGQVTQKESGTLTINDNAGYLKLTQETSTVSAIFNEYIKFSTTVQIMNATFKKGVTFVGGEVYNKIGGNGESSKIIVESGVIEQTSEGEDVNLAVLWIDLYTRVILKNEVTDMAGDIVMRGYLEYLGDNKFTGDREGGILNAGGTVVLKENNQTYVYSDDGSDLIYYDVLENLPIKDEEGNTVAIAHIAHLHTYETVSPTCIEEGYDYCTNTRQQNIVTEDGYTVSYVEEKTNFTSPIGHGNNGWTAENETQHKCNDCGALEDHDSGEVGVTSYEGRNLLSINCTACGMAVDYIAIENGTYMEDLDEIFASYGVEGGLTVNQNQLLNTTAPALPDLVEVYIKEVDSTGTEISSEYKQFRENKANTNGYIYFAFVANGTDGIKLFDGTNDLTVTVSSNVDASLYTTDDINGSIILTAGTYNIYYDYTTQEINVELVKTLILSGLGENNSDLNMVINTDKPSEYVYRGVYGDGTTLLQISNGTEIITVDVSDYASSDLCDIDENTGNIILHANRKYNVYYNTETGKVRLEADSTVLDNVLMNGDTPFSYTVGDTQYYLYVATNVAGTKVIYVLVKK